MYNRLVIYILESSSSFSSYPYSTLKSMFKINSYIYSYRYFLITVEYLFLFLSSFYVYFQLYFKILQILCSDI